jgi:hypothetical protein
MSLTGERRRPRIVTVLVVLAVLAAVIGGAVAGFAWIGWALTEPTDDKAELLVTATVATVVALVQAAVAVGLARGSNAARLVLAIAVALRTINNVFFVVKGEAPEATAFATLAVDLVLLSLLWLPSVTRFFEGERERGLAAAIGTLREDGTREAHRFASAGEYLARCGILAVALWLTPGVTATTWWGIPLAAVGTALAGWALRPVFVRVASAFGWIGAVALALFANAVTMWLGLWIAPGIEVANFGWAVLASWIYAAVMALVTWLFAVSARDYLIVHATRVALRDRVQERSDVPGVLFVQLDGVPAPVLEAEIRAGNVPTIASWIRSGSHDWTEWIARVPSTTPVSQAGLLHGSTENIPAFRWWDRDAGRMLVANKPADAAVIESRITDGRGLLADDGVSISNLFSGDAPRSMLTMSGTGRDDKGLGPSRSYAAFLTHPAGFFRAVLLTCGEMAKELFQGRAQRRRNVVPRIARHGPYVALRGVTNVFLRDLNVTLVVEEMMRGAKSIFVDFVDYDEIAHHAGVTRRESLDALYGLDQVLASLRALADSGATARPYHLVLVSDHGQSQGSTFLQRFGTTLEAIVSSKLGESAVGMPDADHEARGAVRLLTSELAGQGVAGKAVASVVKASTETANGLEKGEATGAGESPLTVIGSGNLGGVWLPGSQGPLDRGAIDASHPGLLDALRQHPGVGFVVVREGQRVVALGAHGERDLDSGKVKGADPLALFPDAAADFSRAARFAAAPDIYVNSLYDPRLDEVAAFEELVGCHGGQGGWQTRPVLVYPAHWGIDEDLLDEMGRLVGAETVHRQMVRWLERLGHREGL